MERHDHYDHDHREKGSYEPTKRRLSWRTRRLVTQVAVCAAFLSAMAWFAMECRGLWDPVTQLVLTPLPDPNAPWGVYSPDPALLTAELDAWPQRLDAGNGDTNQSLAFDYGPDGGYEHRLLQFAATFPKPLRAALAAGVKRYLAPPSSRDGPSWERWSGAWDANKTLWQTDRVRKTSPSWRAAEREGWDHRLLTDPEADQFVLQSLGRSTLAYLWDSLADQPVMRADVLRYLLLLLCGGIYSDTDTVLLRPPSRWGDAASLWDGGAWLSPAQRARLDEGESVDAVQGPPAVIVGVEADVGNRHDWHDWWPRPLQIVQWTMASTPNHPIALDTLLRVVHNTARAAQWARDHYEARQLHSPPSYPLSDGGSEANAGASRPILTSGDANASRVDRVSDSVRSENVESENVGQGEVSETKRKHTRPPLVFREPKDGGPIGIVDWTGPGVWTDAVLTYLRHHGCPWTELRDIKSPLRVGDVVILPVTGFSPGVGNFGAGEIYDPQAMVEHKFRGSWKEGPKITPEKPVQQ